MDEWKLPTKEMAEMIAVSPRRLLQLEKEGHAFKAGRDLWLVRKTVSAFCRFKLSGEVGAGGDDESGFREQRARLTAARADMAEIERRKQMGEVLDREAVREKDAKVAALVKTRLLAIPSKVAPRLVAMRSAAEIKHALETELREATEAIADCEITVEASKSRPQSPRRRRS